MRVFPPPIDIGLHEGFDPEKDIFQRAEFGRSLSLLVQAVEDPLVILLDSPWGSGKTTFIKMWAGELRKSGHPVIYFDAFANDHQENAFLALAAEVIGASASARAAATPARKTFLKRAVKAGRTLLRTSTRIGVKAASLGVIDATDLEAFKSVASDIADATSNSADDLVASILDDQAQAAETLLQFKEALSTLADALKDSHTNQPEVRRPLVFIIDELDRCRPPFALDILEGIKHLFSVDNVHFIIVAHVRQLECSIRFNYGHDLDASLYLQKFYNVITHLPESQSRRHDSDLRKYIDYLRKSLFSNKNTADRDQMLQQIQALAEAKEYSLRSVERIATHLNLALAVTPKTHLKLLPIVPGLVAMKIMSPRLFGAAKKGTLSLSDAIDFLGLAKWKGSTPSAEWMEKWWTFCLADNLPQIPGQNWDRFGNEILFNYNVDDRQSIVPLMANTVVDRLGSPEQ